MPSLRGGGRQRRRQVTAHHSPLTFHPHLIPSLTLTLTLNLTLILTLTPALTLTRSESESESERSDAEDTDCEAALVACGFGPVGPLDARDGASSSHHPALAAAPRSSGRSSYSLQSAVYSP